MRSIQKTLFGLIGSMIFLMVVSQLAGSQHLNFQNLYLAFGFAMTLVGLVVKQIFSFAIKVLILGTVIYLLIHLVPQFFPIFH